MLLGRLAQSPVFLAPSVCSGCFSLWPFTFAVRQSSRLLLDRFGLVFLILLHLGSVNSLYFLEVLGLCLSYSVCTITLYGPR